MKILHLTKTKPDKSTEALINMLSDDAEATIFSVYDNQADYEKLIDLVFENDKIISWW